MTKSEIRQIVITLIACVLTGAIVLFIVRHREKKVAVVDAIKLFNGYQMKKELEMKAAGQLEYLTGIADSIKQELTVKSKVGNTSEKELKELYQEYNNACVNLEQAYQQSNQTINEAVWKRLNPAIDKYGKKQGLHLIIGANGRGSVLYNDAYYDKTKEVIEFVNREYNEGY